MSTARNALYAVVGAGSKALDEAKTLPKRAAALPSFVTSTAQAAAGKAGSLPRLVTTTGKTIRDQVRTLPKQAGNLPKQALELPKQARELPKMAFGAATKVREMTGEALKDATKRYDAYVKAGEKLLARNGSRNGKATVRKSTKPRKPKVAQTATAPAPASAAPTPAE